MDGITKPMFSGYFMGCPIELGELPIFNLTNSMREKPKCDV